MRREGLSSSTTVEKGSLRQDVGPQHQQCPEGKPHYPLSSPVPHLHPLPKPSPLGKILYLQVLNVVQELTMHMSISGSKLPRRARPAPVLFDKQDGAQLPARHSSPLYPPFLQKCLE